MKTLTTRLIIAAAALAAVAASASAQSMKADIPFPFHTSNARLSPGTYLITVDYSAGRQYLVMRNADTRAGVMLLHYVDAIEPMSMHDNRARLTFECSGRACVLRELWKGGGNGGFQFLGPKLPRGEDTRIAEVALTSLKAD